MKYTVNSLLVMQKSLRIRMSQLNELKNESTHRTIFTETKQIEEPVYDVKRVDTKIVRINNALFEIDRAIKESNAKTKVNVSINYQNLTTPIE